MSLACVEAMQAGLPLLITEFAGIDRFVPGEMGLLIEDNVASIEAAITRCLANPGQLARWSEAARGAAANLSWRDYECAIAAICRDALGVAA